MREINDILINLKKSKQLKFNIENFYMNADEDRYYSYLNDIILKYVKNKDKVLSYIKEHNFGENNIVNGIFCKEGKLTCVVPQRKKLLDEMINIHEITHLVNNLISIDDDETISKEIIPFFNEYEYLKEINPFYAECYKILRYNNAIEAAKIINEKNYNDCLSYINAYYVLIDKEYNYDINKLNKINAKSKRLEKTLELKGYTF